MFRLLFLWSMWEVLPVRDCERTCHNTLLDNIFWWLCFAGTEGSRQLLNCSEACDLPMLCPRDTSQLALRAFGLASYKLKGALWTSNLERRHATLLQNSADAHLKQLGVQHPDYIFFTSRSNSGRWVLAFMLESSLYLLQCCHDGQNATMQGHKQSVELFSKTPCHVK